MALHKPCMTPQCMAVCTGCAAELSAARPLTRAELVKVVSAAHIVRFLHDIVVSTFGKVILDGLALGLNDSGFSQASFADLHVG